MEQNRKARKMSKYKQLPKAKRMYGVTNKTILFHSTAILLAESKNSTSGNTCAGNSRISPQQMLPEIKRAADRYGAYHLLRNNKLSLPSPHMSAPTFWPMRPSKNSTHETGDRREEETSEANCSRPLYPHLPFATSRRSAKIFNTNHPKPQPVVFSQMYPRQPPLTRSPSTPLLQKEHHGTH